MDTRRPNPEAGEEWPEEALGLFVPARPRPAAERLALASPLALGALFVFCAVATTPMNWAIAVAGWAVWEGGTALTLSRRTGGSTRERRVYVAALLSSSCLAVLLFWPFRWAWHGIETSSWPWMYQGPEGGDALGTDLTFGAFVAWAPVFVALYLISVWFVDAHLARARRGVDAEPSLGLVLLALLLPPVWLLVVRWRVGRLIGASTRRPNSASPAA